MMKRRFSFDPMVYTQNANMGNICRILVLLLLIFAVSTGTVFGAPGAWPGTDVWPLNQSEASSNYVYKDTSQNPIRDFDDDIPSAYLDVSSHGASDATGDWNSAYFYADSTNIYFRLLLSEDPSKSTGDPEWKQFGWSVEIDADGDGSTDWSIGINGVNEKVVVKCFDSLVVDETRTAAAYARKLDSGVASVWNSGENMWYADWQVELSALSDGEGGCPDIGTDTVIRLYYGTSANGQNVNKDYFNTAGATLSFSEMGYVTPETPTGTGPTGSPF